MSSSRSAQLLSLENNQKKLLFSSFALVYKWLLGASEIRVIDIRLVCAPVPLGEPNQVLSKCKYGMSVSLPESIHTETTWFLNMQVMDIVY